MWPRTNWVGLGTVRLDLNLLMLVATKLGNTHWIVTPKCWVSSDKSRLNFSTNAWQKKIIIIIIIKIYSNKSNSVKNPAYSKPRDVIGYEASSNPQNSFLVVLSPVIWCPKLYCLNPPIIFKVFRKILQVTSGITYNFTQFTTENGGLK
jgi:hypothetical protein